MVRKTLFPMLMLLVLSLGTARANGPDRAALSPVVNEASNMLILDNDRIKPLVTFARYTLYQLSGRFSYKGTPAITWLCRVIFSPQNSVDEEVFLINNPEVADAIGITPMKKRRYSLSQLSPGLEKLEKEAGKIVAVEAGSRSPVENEILRTAYNVRKYLDLCNVFSFASPQPEFTIIDSSLASYLGFKGPVRQLSYLELLGKSQLISAAMKNIKTDSINSWTRFDSACIMLTTAMYRWSNADQSVGFHIVPLEEKTGIIWQDPWKSVQVLGSGSLNDRAVVALTKAYEAYGKGLFAECAEKLRDFNSDVHSRISEKGIHVQAALENAYNSIDPFFKAKLAYFIAVLFLMAGLFINARSLTVCGGILISAGFLFHTFGCVARAIIMQRPPVTTLYETFVFVAWVSVVLGLCIELYRKKAFGLFIASFSGAIFLYCAGKFGAESDTMGMLAPVLNNNFWLATHIMTISMGYAGVFGAGVLAHIYLVQKAFLKRTMEQCANTIASVCAALAFGLIFTTIGTVLGGMWADQAWGRFWGWDPKENGALLIIIWCAIVFHARKGRIIKETGTAFGALIGLSLVMLAWLGVNLLGIGMHAYGFTMLGAKMLYGIIAGEMVFVLAISLRMLISSKKTIQSGN
jgi:ABC-type transport system involved in cytochrome c biogenesis permease subunit